MNTITFLFQISILLIMMIYSTQDAITIDTLFGECQVSVCGNVFVQQAQMVNVLNLLVYVRMGISQL